MLPQLESLRILERASVEKIAQIVGPSPSASGYIRPLRSLAFAPRWSEKQQWAITYLENQYTVRSMWKAVIPDMQDLHTTDSDLEDMRRVGWGRTPLDDIYPTLKNFAVMAMTSGNLTHLSLSPDSSPDCQYHEWFAPYLEQIGKGIPSIRTLGIVIVEDSILRDWNKWKAAFAAFRNLEGLGPEWRHTNQRFFPSRFYRDPANHVLIQGLLIELGELCPRLTRVDDWIKVDGYWRKDGKDAS
ncbi:hypothetical protein CALVIDRAFT_594511 [Calocera viscosa TUFC12733]|uniref:Uncharacterized protein n=1 Tax=Calocera viscosa (strain TUFC12733) TaxID=1330018 RepID=A0A167SE66_CALVF|nr:hypothetical protein CALVIDRAFT_594511 [Calocera viscosa TUFC12733]